MRNIRYDVVILIICTVLYMIILSTVNFGGVVCEDGEGYIKCTREWMVALSTFGGAISVGIISYIALCIDRERELHSAKKDGKNYTIMCRAAVNELLKLKLSLVALYWSRGKSIRYEFVSGLVGDISRIERELATLDSLDYHNDGHVELIKLHRNLDVWKLLSGEFLLEAALTRWDKNEIIPSDKICGGNRENLINLVKIIDKYVDYVNVLCLKFDVLPINPNVGLGGYLSDSSVNG